MPENSELILQPDLTQYSLPFGNNIQVKFCLIKKTDGFRFVIVSLECVEDFFPYALVH